MPKQVTMPRLDKDMDEGRIAKWKRSEGEWVESGSVLFEIETDKAVLEVEAASEGTLHHILVGEGDLAAVNSIVAWIYEKDEVVGPPPTAEDTSSTSVEKAKPKMPVVAEGPDELGSGVEKRIEATPAARAEAKSRNIRLDTVIGTGPAGRIQKSDIMWVAAAPASTKTATLSTSLSKDKLGGLSVLSSGGGAGLPVIMIHGFMSDGSTWEKLMKPLARRHRIHRIELPCHGRSPLRRVSGFAELVSELRHILDSFDLDRCHLIGHSLGGALALALADTRPRKVASLVMIAPAGLGPEINGDVISGLCRASCAESLGPWMKMLTSDPDKIGWSYVQAAAVARSDTAMRISQMEMANVLFPDGTQAFDMRAALDRLTVPARMIWGRDDRIIPWEHALNSSGHVSLNLFTGVGHMPQYEIPEQIGVLLSDLE